MKVLGVCLVLVVIVGMVWAQPKKPRSVKEWRDIDLKEEEKKAVGDEEDDKAWGLEGWPKSHGPGIMFVHVKEKMTQAEFDDISAKWATLAISAGLEMRMFKSSEKEFVVTPMKQMSYPGLLTFFLNEPEIEKVNLNGRDFFPKKKEAKEDL